MHLVLLNYWKEFTLWRKNWLFLKGQLGSKTSSELMASCGMLCFMNFSFILLLFHDFKYNGDGKVLHFTNFCFIVLHFEALNTVLTEEVKLHQERFCSSNCTCQGRSGTDAHGWINKLWLQRFRTRILTDPSHDNTSGSHGNIICCWTLRACEYRCAKG